YSVVLVNSSLDLSGLPAMKSKVPNASKYDFSKAAKADEVTHVLVVEFDFVGVRRSYSSYIPTSAPQVVILGATYLVDLSSNTYKWYKPLAVYRNAEGEWDEPPVFPGMTNAYYEAVES